MSVSAASPAIVPENPTPSFFQFVCDAASTSDTYCAHLTPTEVAFVKNLLQDHPEVFHQIQATVTDIVADGKLNLHDLPKVVLLISQIYHAHLVENVVHHVGVIHLVKFTVDALLESGAVPLPDLEIALIKKVVDASLDLLQTNVHVVPGKCSGFTSWVRRVCTAFSHPFGTKKYAPLSQGRGCGGGCGCLPVRTGTECTGCTECKCDDGCACREPSCSCLKGANVATCCSKKPADGAAEDKKEI